MWMLRRQQPIPSALREEAHRSRGASSCTRAPSHGLLDISFDRYPPIITILFGDAPNVGVLASAV